jgi:hypothetical protein
MRRIDTGERKIYTFHVLLMSDKAQDNSDTDLSRSLDQGRRFRLTDFLIILFCLLGAVYSVIMFRTDLFRTLDAGKVNPVGTVIAGNNVQRRMANWLLWDSLSVDSLVYLGDTIRTVDLSGATLSIERNSINLNEKTLIRIQRSLEDDSVLIYLDEGNLVLTTVAGGGNIALNLMGRLVETGPGTVLSASAGKDGAVVQISEGTAILSGDGQRREIVSGTMIALDSGGGVTEAILSTEQLAAKNTPETALANLVTDQPESVPLPAPLNRLPPTGHRIGIEQLKESNSIVFTWSAVSGANAYIFTLFQDSTGGRRQIIRIPPGNRRDWTLENLEALGDGTFFWQVEAVNVSEGTVERRGRIAENSFVIDIPHSGMVEINEQ